MPATTQTVSAVLKEVYEGRIQGQQNDEAIAIKRVEKTSEGVVDTVGGKYVTFPVRVKRNTGISYRAEMGQLAAAGEQGYAAVTTPLLYGYGRFQVTGQMMELAESNYQAFSSTMDEEMDRLKTDLVKDSNRIAYGHTTRNGVIAVPTTGVASATQTVDNAQYFEPGMKVDHVNHSTGAVVDTGLTVVSVNEETKSVVFSASHTTVAVSSGYVRVGNLDKEPIGFAKMIYYGAGAYHGIDPATQPIWVSNRVYNTAAPGTAIALSETSMIKACDLSRRKGGKITAVFTSLGVRRSYFNLLKGDRRFVNSQEFTGGLVGLPFTYSGRDIPVVDDPDAPYSKMWFTDESKIKEYRKRPWYFDDADGNVLKWVKDYDAYEGMAKQYWELGTSQRNAHTVYEDIIES